MKTEGRHIPKRIDTFSYQQTRTEAVPPLMHPHLHCMQAIQRCAASLSSKPSSPSPPALLKEGRKGGREGGRERGKERGRKGRRERGRKGRKQGGREGWREGGREEGRREMLKMEVYSDKMERGKTSAA